MAENWCISVTEEQKKKISELFQENNWQLNEVPSHQELDDIEIDDEPGYVISQTPGETECLHCFSKPCVTNEQNRQLWWATENQEPSQENNKLRKDKYKRFWTMLYHRRVWNDPRYIDRKLAALGKDTDDIDEVWITNPGLLHKRDIMPKCVTNLVRDWYPKTSSQNYMDHLWE